jgi:HlyD family secretion protein
MSESANNNAPSSTAGIGSEPPSLSDRVRSLRLPDRPAGQTRAVALVPWVLCALLAVGAGYLGFSRPNDADYQKFLELKKSNPDDLEALVNQAKDPEKKPRPAGAQAKGAFALESKGYIIPISLIQVSPKVGGMVEKLYIKEGDRVEKGKVLAELEEIDYKADYDRALATLDELWKYRDQEIEQCKADWEDCKAQRDQLFVDFNRSLVLKNSNALPVKDYEQAESAFKSMDFRTKRLKLAYDLLIKGQRDERIAAAKADLKKAKWRWENTKVIAPIDGIILTKKAEEGNQINPAAFSNGLSASLCEMADLTKMEVDLAVAERDISKVFDEQECAVRAEAFPDRTYVGWVSRRMPTGDRSKGAVPVRVQIKIAREEEGEYLRPEMGAVVTFLNNKIDPNKKK